MSVDTYLKGKNLNPYTAVEHGDLRLLFSPRIFAWARSVELTTRNWGLRRTLKLRVEHNHTAACRH